MSKYPFTDSPLKSFPYHSRTWNNEFSTNISKNYVLHGFKPGNALQASELNEIQENFYKNLTLNNYLLKNWLFMGSPDFTSGNGDAIYGPSWVGAVPFNPFTSIHVSGNVITFKKDWYLVDDFSSIKFWIYNNNEITHTIDSTKPYIGLFISKKIVTPANTTSETTDPDLFDNSNGFINSTLSPGADRYSLNFTNSYDSTTRTSDASTSIGRRDIFKLSTDGTLRYINNLVHQNQ